MLPIKHSFSVAMDILKMWKNHREEEKKKNENTNEIQS